MSKICVPICLYIEYIIALFPFFLSSVRHWHTARLFEWHANSEAINKISMLRFVPSVDSVTTVEGLRVIAKEISFLRFVPSVDSVATVEGLRGLFKENLFPNLFY